MEEPWSSGQAEGQINHLKILKRQMYLRAKRDLLTARMVAACGTKTAVKVIQSPDWMAFDRSAVPADLPTACPEPYRGNREAAAAEPRFPSVHRIPPPMPC